MTQEYSSSSDRIFILASLSAVIAVGIAGFWLLGSPAKQRLISLDAERVSDLSAISEQIWQQTGGVNGDPPGPLLDVLPPTAQRTNIYLDPETGEPYEYRRLSDQAYELCATFTLESLDDDADRDWQQDPYWKHPAGRYCYKFDVATGRSPIPTDPVSAE